MMIIANSFCFHFWKGGELGKQSKELERGIFPSFTANKGSTDRKLFETEKTILPDVIALLNLGASFSFDSYFSSLRGVECIFLVVLPIFPWGLISIMESEKMGHDNGRSDRDGEKTDGRSEFFLLNHAHMKTEL